MVKKNQEKEGRFLENTIRMGQTYETAVSLRVRETAEGKGGQPIGDCFCGRGGCWGRGKRGGIGQSPSRRCPALEKGAYVPTAGRLKKKKRGERK